MMFWKPTFYVLVTERDNLDRNSWYIVQPAERRIFKYLITKKHQITD